jgi:hypothetical protein
VAWRFAQARQDVAWKLAIKSFSGFFFTQIILQKVGRFARIAPYLTSTSEIG